MASTKKPAAKKAPAKKAPGKKVARLTVDAEAPKAEKRPVGRPSSYKPEYNEQARKLCLLGYTDAELADFFGVVEDTINEWKVVHPDFSVSICSGKELADADIANSLYQRAKGYSHDEDDIRTISVGGGRSDIVITPTTKHYPPDTAAASLWLRNRQGRRWRDKVDLEHSGGLTLEKLPDEVLKDRVEEMFKRMQAKQ